MLERDDLRLLEALENCSLPEGGFRHRDHVRAARAILLLEDPAPALARFSTALRRYALHAGTPEIYHETITWAFLFAVNERIAELGEGHRWRDFVRAYPELIEDGRSFVDRYYSRSRIDSEIARERFLLPDRAGVDAHREESQ